MPVTMDFIAHIRRRHLSACAGFRWQQLGAQGAHALGRQPEEIANHPDRCAVLYEIFKQERVASDPVKLIEMARDFLLVNNQPDR